MKTSTQQFRRRVKRFTGPDGKRFGVEGLRTTKIQDYHDLELETEINGKLTPPLPLIVIISYISFVGK